MGYSVFEMEIWEAPEKVEMPDEQECRERLERLGVITSDRYCSSIGYYASREQAEQRLEELKLSGLPGNCFPAFAMIRQRPTGLQECYDAYIREWSYEGCIMVDESLLPSFDVGRHPFLGRPASMIRHRKEDIVLVVGEGPVHWGIIYSFWGTEEKVSEVNRRAREKGYVLDGTASVLDYTDDKYILLVSDEDYSRSQRHIPAHHVFKPDVPVPDAVRRILEEGLRKTGDPGPHP